MEGDLPRLKARIYETAFSKVVREVVLGNQSNLAREVDLHLFLHLFGYFSKNFVYILRICHNSLLKSLEIQGFIFIFAVQHWE